MRDHLLGFQSIAALVAEQHPRPTQHVTPPPLRFSDEEQEKRRMLDPHIIGIDLGDMKPTVTGTPSQSTIPEGWSTCLPPHAGWYSVGSKKSEYLPDKIRAYFDGTRWTHWISMIDPSVNGTCTDGKIDKYAMAWLHEVHVEDEDRRKLDMPMKPTVTEDDSAKDGEVAGRLGWSHLCASLDIIFYRMLSK